MIRAAFVAGLVFLATAFTARAEEKSYTDIPPILRALFERSETKSVSEINLNGLTLVIEPVDHYAREPADGHLCMRMRVAAVPLRSFPGRYPMNQMTVVAITDSGETLELPPHFWLWRGGGEVRPRTTYHAITFLAPETPADTFTLTVTIPEALNVAEWRTVEIELAPGGEPPAELDLPGLKSVERVEHDVGLGYKIVFSSDWLPDSDPEWAGVMWEISHVVLEGGNYGSAILHCSWGKPTVNGVKHAVDVACNLRLFDKGKGPVRLLLRLPASGKREDIVVELKGISIEPLICDKDRVDTFEFKIDS